MQTGSGIVALATVAILICGGSGILAGLSGMALFIAVLPDHFWRAVLFPTAWRWRSATQKSTVLIIRDGAVRLSAAVSGGVAAAGAVLLEHHGLWALAIALLGTAGWLMVKLRM